MDTIEIPIEKLKEMLMIDGMKTYENYKEMNKKILKPSREEIQNNTDMEYSYEPLRKGRQITAIRFKIEKKRRLKLHNGKVVGEIGGM